MTPTMTRWLFIGAVVVVIGFEAYVVHEFVTERNPSVEIQGAGQLLIEDFGRGVPVEQVFTMHGAGLRGVSVLLSADRAVSLRGLCELRQVYENAPAAQIVLYRWRTDFGRVSGTEWHRIDFPPLAASDHRLYAFRLQIEKPGDAANGPPPTSNADPSRPRIAIAASAAPVPGAGRFLVGADPWAGSLFLRAHAEGETAYDKFQRTLEIRLPRPLRNRVVLAVIVIVYHWALLTYAYAMLVGGLSTTREGDLQPSASRDRLLITRS
jgi:hypothetical protein